MSEIIVQLTAEGADQVKRETVALTNEFDELANAITLSKEKLKGMREGSKEFNTLQREIQATEKTLESMSGSTQKSTTRIRDMREQMINLRQTMQELEKAGLKNTEQYKNLDNFLSNFVDSNNNTYKYYFDKELLMFPYKIKIFACAKIFL